MMRTFLSTQKLPSYFLLFFAAHLMLCASAHAVGTSPAGASHQDPIAAQGGGMTLLDWIVLFVYAGGLLLIGVYYSRRNRSADDYLLGGRTMKPWLVGLSMFATFFSVLTYLAIPGEMIANGPQTLAQVIGYAVAGIVVCWVIIPYIMRFSVTSGYEILETRFGEDIRLLGAAIFLTIRFMWMGLVIYATVDKVLIPILEIDPSWAPVVCTVLVLITVVYASMGGLRAVVLSDAIQAIILCLGAVLAVVLISGKLGSVTNWFPTTWHGHWNEFRIWYSPNSRIDILSVMTGIAFWWIATASSDQMAIQRYLSTRDVRSARRMLCLSLTVNGVLACVLGLLGLALLGYFQQHPEMLAEKQDLVKNADQLLPRYILIGLPAGLSGLVIAALVAATMSSLSSGVNSASSVITTDLIGRFRKTPFSEEQRLRMARWVSWGVGICAILLSLVTGLVEGNLIDKCQKIANLFTAPLFMLFFMAIFIPWATRLGVWAAVIASGSAAVGIAFFNWFGWVGIFWILIGSMITGVIVGPTVSAVERLVLGMMKRSK